MLDIFPNHGSLNYRLNTLHHIKNSNLCDMSLLSFFNSVSVSKPKNSIRFIPSASNISSLPSDATIVSKSQALENETDQNPGKTDNRQAGITLDDLIQKNCGNFKNGSPVYLHPLLNNGHLQTCVSTLMHQDKCPIYYQRSMISYPDNGVGAVDIVNLKVTKAALVKGVNDKLVINFENANSELKGNLKLDDDGYFLERELPSRTYYFEDMNQGLDACSSADRPLIILLHGLSGGSQENYIRLFIEEIISNPDNIEEQEFDILVLNSRGCSHTVIETPRLYNGLWTDDIRYLINEKILKTNPEKQIYLAGFSLGGVVLSNFLAQESRLNSKILNKNIKCGIAISVPWDLWDSSIFLESSFIGKYLYSQAMCKSLIRLVTDNYSNLKFNENIDRELLKNVVEKNTGKHHIKYIKDFDNAFTCKIFNLNNYEEYYKFASPSLRMNQVRVPLIIVHAKDDPIVGPRTPELQVEQNPYLYCITTPIGGHVCWFDRHMKQWYNEPVFQLIKSFHEEITKPKLQISVEESHLPKLGAFQVDRLVADGSYSELLMKKTD